MTGPRRAKPKKTAIVLTFLNSPTLSFAIMLYRGLATRVVCAGG